MTEAGEPSSRPATALVREIESALMSTWPAIRTAIEGAWLVRTAEGFSGRANAVTILDPGDDDDVEARIAWAESVFGGQGLVPVFRETPLMPAAVRGALRERGYGPGQATHMLHGRLPAPNADDIGTEGHGAQVRGFDTPDGPWIEAARQCSPRIASGGDAVLRMLSAMATPARYIAVEDADGPAAVVQAGLHRGMLTVHNVATHPERRRRGHARRAMAAALDWGRAEEASRFWIAVEAGNAPARALYAGYGLADIYRYRYWSRA